MQSRRGSGRSVVVVVDDDEFGGRGKDVCAKNFWMQFISPWRRGEADSAFVAVVMGSRSRFERIEAPKSLLPEVTASLVSGIMWFSMVARRALRRVVGEES